MLRLYAKYSDAIFQEKLKDENLSHKKDKDLTIISYFLKKNWNSRFKLVA